MRRVRPTRGISWPSACTSGVGAGKAHRPQLSRQAVVMYDGFFAHSPDEAQPGQPG